jgi:hypothetical protein
VANVAPTSEEAPAPAAELCGSADAIAYRCVCGELIQPGPQGDAVCPCCGRQYARDVLVASGADTVSLSSSRQAAVALPLAVSEEGATEFLVGDAPVAPTASLVDAGVRSAASTEAAAPANDAMHGRRFQHFRVLGRVGGGGMGTVFRALDESLQRHVALKVLRRDRSKSDDDRWNRLVLEARAQARVNHPNIVHIYYIGSDGELPFLAMEFVSGPTMADRLRQGPLPYVEVVAIALQLVDALAQAHAFGIVHGDIKPSNILQVAPGVVKLSDFGMAFEAVEGGAMVKGGTPFYLSPEAAAGLSRDFRSDLYSLGVTLFELTFGRLPYRLSNRSLKECLDAHLSRVPEFPEPWPAEVPRAWGAVLQCLLAKRPEQRFGSFAELRAELVKLRPLTRVPAARMTRGIAWGLDLILLIVVPTLIGEIATIRMPVARQPNLLPVLVRFFQWLLVALYVLLQGRTGSSPGKRLLQLQIADGFGLRPATRVLTLRGLLQVFWLVPPTLIRAFSDWAGLVRLVDLACGTWMVVNIVLVLVARRALHDYICATEVVLPTPGAEPSSRVPGDGRATRLTGIG